MAKITIGGDDSKKGARECPECGSEMEMTRVTRVKGASGMFWVCTDRGCGAAINKAGAQLDSLELR